MEGSTSLSSIGATNINQNYLEHIGKLEDDFKSLNLLVEFAGDFKVVVE
jgi:hypothetical protein